MSIFEMVKELLKNGFIDDADGYDYWCTGVYVMHRTYDTTVVLTRRDDLGHLHFHPFYFDRSQNRMHLAKWLADENEPIITDWYNIKEPEKIVESYNIWSTNKLQLIDKQTLDQLQ